MTAYSITDLGTLQGDAPSPSAINTAGVITGGLMNRAFRYKSAPASAERQRRNGERHQLIEPGTDRRVDRPNREL